MCAHKQLTIFKLYEPPENGARRLAHVRLTWVTRLFCPASRRESLPLATIWSFYLYLADEPQKITKLRAGETLTGMC